MSPARDLGEPLEREVIGRHETPVVFDKNRNLLLKEDLDIVVQRANALQGCGDPKAFIARIAEIIREAGEVDLFVTGSEAWSQKVSGVLELICDNSALDWLREKKA